MENDFKYIRNRIKEYKQIELLDRCFNILEQNNNDIAFPIWSVFLLIKWSYQYGDDFGSKKLLTDEKFLKLYKQIQNFNEDHVGGFIKERNISKAFQILFYQQIYLQEKVYKEKFAAQLLLYSGLKGKYNFEMTFIEKTGLSFFDFLFLQQMFWICINSDQKEFGKFINNGGYISTEIIDLLSVVISKDKVLIFIQLLLLNPFSPNENINEFKRKIERCDLQPYESTFLIKHPFHLYSNGLRLIHKSLFNYSSCYYLYDFLKSNDEKFTTEFGNRLEKYVELGLKESNIIYLKEVEIKKMLPSNSKVIDFYLEEENIFIECKATELSPISSINPTDSLIYNSLEDSLFKAYFKQLFHVAKTLKPNSENYGIILTYKPIFWSTFTELFLIGKSNYCESDYFDHLPPENVFFIDLYTWDKIIQIIKDKKSTLKEILQIAAKNNANEKTKKQFFDMHLEKFNLVTFDLLYLIKERDKLSDFEKLYNLNS